MKNLNTIIRACKLQLDEKRRQLAGFQKMRADLDVEMARLESEVARERRLDTEEEIALMYAAYAEGVKVRRSALEGAMTDVDVALDDIGGQVATKYQELKRFEIALEARKQDQEKIEARSEQTELDEIGATMHRRAVRQ